MVTSWITTSSINMEAVVNPLIAACEREIIPDRLYFTKTAQVAEEMEAVERLAREVIDAYGGSEPDVHTTELDQEQDFDTLHSHVKSAVEATKEIDGYAAVDITPGRKFMTAISFAAGMQYGADSVYYLYLNPRKYGLLYPELPRSGVTLYDFTEEL
jgi:CRISPR/Cas system-associated protein Csm6